MDERVVQFRVGVMVFATAIITLILVAMFGELPRIIHGTYSVRIWLREAPGVTPDTPVRKSGILIGRVTEVRFAEEVGDAEDIENAMAVQGISREEYNRGVIVTAEINEPNRIYDDEVCRVSSTLLGDAALQIVRVDQKGLPGAPGEQGSRGQRITGGQWVRGTIADDPMEALLDMQEGISQAIGSVTGAAAAMEKASGGLGSAMDKVRNMLEENEEGISNAVAQSGKTMKAIEKAANNLNALIGDEATQKQLKDSLTELPLTIREIRNTVTHMQTTMGLVDGNLRNLDQFTAALGDEKLLTRLDRAVRNLDRLMEDVSTFGQALNTRQGSLGQFVHNRELYDNLNRASQNIDLLVRQLKPIVNDVRVFTDKIARDPGRLGVRGALQRNVPIK